MRRFVLFVFVLAVFPAALFAASATLNPASGATGTTGPATSTASVTIPATISIDVESNVTFDFSDTTHYHSPLSTTDCTDAFPPGAACTTVTYTPSTVTTAAAGGTAGEIWLAIFSNKTGVQTTMTVQAYGPAAFSTDPGFVPQKIQLAKGTVNSGPNGAQYGLSPADFIGTAATPKDLKVTAPTSSVFGWTRIDQIPKLVLPGNQTFNVVTASTAAISFTLSY